MKKYEVTVFLDIDYKENESFIFETDKPVVNFDDQGRNEIIEEIHRRFPSWFACDYKEIDNQ